MKARSNKKKKSKKRKYYLMRNISLNSQIYRALGDPKKKKKTPWLIPLLSLISG